MKAETCKSKYGTFEEASAYVSSIQNEKTQTDWDNGFFINRIAKITITRDKHNDWIVTEQFIMKVKQ